MTNRRGAGSTEYIVLLGIVLAVAMLIFWGSISTAIVDKMNEMGFEVQWSPKKPKPEKPEPIPPDPETEPRRPWNPWDNSPGGTSSGGGISGSGSNPHTSTGTFRQR